MRYQQLGWGLCGLAVLLTGCSREKENPLLSDLNVGYIKNYTYRGYASFDDPTFDTDCKAYLTGQEKPAKALKERCDKGVEIIFSVISKAANVGTNASAQEKHDPRLWTMVLNPLPQSGT